MSFWKKRSDLTIADDQTKSYTKQPEINVYNKYSYFTCKKQSVEDDELEVTGVKLDPQSRTGIWMSEDVGKVFSHSILNKNLLSNRKNYESLSSKLFKPKQFIS